MSATTEIAWCDATFNPWIGCTKVSPGCAHCYAESDDKRRKWTAQGWGAGKPRTRTSVANWRGPVQWNAAVERGHFRRCPGCGWRGVVNGDDMPCPTKGCEMYSLDMECVRMRVFCASLADWLDDEVPVEWLADLLALIHATPNLDWLLLTKRPGNFANRMEDAYCTVGSDRDDFRQWLSTWLYSVNYLESQRRGAEPDNVWIGTTVEDQTRAEERIPELLKIPARVRFLSCEPLLGRVDLRGPWMPRCNHRVDAPPIRWVICGGESGPNARPMHPDWARDLHLQCAEADVPFFFKQWGEWVPTCAQYPQTEAEHEEADSVGLRGDIALEPNGVIADGYQPVSRRTWLLDLVGKKAAGRLLDGALHDAFPQL